MTDQQLLWAAFGGLGLLALLCLPIATLSKFVLELGALTLRVGLLGVLAAGAYLGAYPSELPAGVSAVLDDFPRLVANLPDRASPLFGPCAAMIVAAVLLPALAALDVARKLAGRRLRRLRELADERAVPVEVARPAAETAPVAVPVLRPVDRRTAASALATAGRRRPTASVN